MTTGFVPAEGLALEILLTELFASGSQNPVPRSSAACISNTRVAKLKGNRPEMGHIGAGTIRYLKGKNQKS